MPSFQFTTKTTVPEELASCVKVSVSSVFHKAFGYFPSFQDDDEETHKIGDGVVGIVSLVFAVALLIYGKWFLRKLKGVSYL